MSINTVPVESVTFAQFIQRWIEERWQVDDFHTVGAYGDGTRVVVRIKDELKAYNLTDLVGARIVRSGTVNATIAAGAVGTGTINVTISPALPNTTDFRSWGNPRVQASPFVSTLGISTRISSATNLQFNLGRMLSVTQLNAGSTGATATYPSDTQIDVGLGHTHQGDSGSIPDHAHTITNTAVAFNVTADWYISSLAE